MDGCGLIEDQETRYYGRIDIILTTSCGLIKGQETRY